MEKALHQALYDAIRLRNKFCKMPPKENEKLYRNEEMSQFEKKIEIIPTNYKIKHNHIFFKKK